MTAKMVRPITVDDDILTSTSVSETASAWDDAYAYAPGVQARDAATHRIYENLAGTKLLCTFIEASNLIVRTAHGLVLNDTVTFIGDDLPPELTPGTIFYVVSSGLSADQFRVSTSMGGSVQSLSGTYSGTNYFVTDYNLNKSPVDPMYNSGDDAVWIDAGPDNTFALHDGANTTRTTDTDAIVNEYDFTGHPLDSIGFLGMENATSITIVCDSTGSGEVYNETYSLADTGFDEGWTTPALTESAWLSDYAVSDIPPYDDMTVTITITRSGGGEVGIGEVVFGLSKDIGDPLDKSSGGWKDYSRKDYDPDFGTLTLVPRGYSRRGTFAMRCDDDRADGLADLFGRYRATAALWLMTPGAQGIGIPWAPRGIIYGIWTSFEFTYNRDGPDKYSISLEGLV